VHAGDSENLGPQPRKDKTGGIVSRDQTL